MGWVAEREYPPKQRQPQWLTKAFVALLILGAGAYLAPRAWNAMNPSPVTGMTPELGKLWAPFVNSKRPLILSIEDPLFAEVRSNPGVYLRDRSMNQWNDVVNSPAVKTLTGALKQTDVQPSRYYTAFGEVEASFMLENCLDHMSRTLSSSGRVSFPGKVSPTTTSSS